MKFFDCIRQVSGLKKQGVEVGMVTATTPQEEHGRLLKEMSNPNSTMKLIYVTPEKIAKAKRLEIYYQSTHLLTLVSNILNLMISILMIYKRTDFAKKQILSAVQLLFAISNCNS